MTRLAERLKDRFFGDDVHPYRRLEQAVDSHLRPDSVLLDAGCGWTAPVLKRYRGKAGRLIGIDLVEFPEPVEGIELYRRDLGDTGLKSGSVDLIMARSVMEHIEDPERVYREFARILAPGGRLIFITANRWDYASIIATLIPNRFHPWIVRHTEGRAECDVFPTQYKTNTRKAVHRHASSAGLEVANFSFLGQYPNYFMFNGLLFLIATGYEKLLRRFDILSPLRGWIFADIVKPNPNPKEEPERDSARRETCAT